MNVFNIDRTYYHKNLIFWVAMIRSMASPVFPNHRIMDFGCGQGLFLQLLYDYFPYQQGIGVDMDNDSVDYAKQLLLNQKIQYPIQYYTNSQFHFKNHQNSFDIIFCQEILWCNEHITEIAQIIYDLLIPNGQCYMTVGCHDENPMWTYRKNLMNKEQIANYTHNLDKIAKTFSDVGFKVGMRRLPLEGFLMFNPSKSFDDNYSFSQLVKSSYENKMLFYFEKSPIDYGIDTIQG